MNTKRIAILLAGVFTVFCLPLSTLAAPTRAPSQAARPAPQSSGPSMADIEAALKEHKEIEQKLLSRIHDLENTQKKLLEQTSQATDSETVQRLQFRIVDLENALAKALENSKKTPEREQGILREQPRPNASFDWMLGGAALFTFALCVILLLRMQRSKTSDELRGQVVSIVPDKIFSPAIGPTPPAPVTVTGVEPSPPDHPFVPPLPDWDAASPAFDLQSLKALFTGENVRSRDSTIELAEIMLSFGRINSAAEALANFIENNPKEAFVPWLKLLEVYRANGQRTEFDKIAKKLNKTFNVWTVDWDNFNDARASAHRLETMPHIVERLRGLWGTRECQAYLQYLLRDTRDETRRGFSLATIDDILCLNDILEYCLGPYTGPTSTFDELLDCAPPTETENEKR
jgi:exonuclease VII large subunit